MPSVCLPTDLHTPIAHPCCCTACRQASRIHKANDQSGSGQPSPTSAIALFLSSPAHRVPSSAAVQQPALVQQAGVHLVHPQGGFRELAILSLCIQWLKWQWYWSFMISRSSMVKGTFCIRRLAIVPTRTDDEMVVRVQVLSVASVETAPSLMVATETQRLLFDVGDGTQRMCMEHHVRLAKMKNAFLTELRAHTVGGLPGMVLTVSDSGKEGMRVCGPEGTARYLRATRHFLYRPKFELQAHEVAHLAMSGGDEQGDAAVAYEPVYKDEEVLVHAVAVRGRSGGAKRKLGETSVPIGSVSGGDCVTYIVETPEQRGKFLVEKAVALGVPKGKLFGQLHQGKDVTLPDGRIVRSSDCVSPSLPGSGCAIVSCASVAHVDDLVSSSRFARYQWHTAANKDPGSDAKPQAPLIQLQVVYHFGDQSVLQHPSYVAWARRFGDDVDHVLLNSNGCAEKTVYRSSAKLLAQLHSVFPNAFPSNNYELRDSEAPFSRRVEMPLSSKPVILGESLLAYTIAPLVRRGFDATNCFQRVNYEEVQASTASFQQTNPTMQQATTQALPDHLNGRITFLGTGCAIPSKYRNVTGNYLQLPDAKNPGVTNGLMLDCGEGTLGQLYRYTNGDLSKLRELVQGLKCIWISHNHADHHLGLLRILSFRSHDEGDEPLLIIGPTPVMYWLQEYSEVDSNVCGKYTFVENHSFDESDEKFQESIPISKPTRAWLQDTLQISDFTCVRVKHGFKSYAVVFKWQDTLKIAFSGDCRPSELLADKAKDAFLFIHEATFDETMDEEAKQKDHSTTFEAIEVGQKALAKHMILTHFSQRYPKMPALDSTVTDTDTISAMDLLSLQFSDLHTQAQLMEVCMQILALDEQNEDDEGDD